MTTPYLVTCPYCNERISKNSKGKHLDQNHPKESHASDPGFPGWKDQ